MMGSLKWEACFFLLVTSVFHTRSEEPWDNCITDAEVKNKVICDFESNNCAWENMLGNDINWTRTDHWSGSHFMSLSMESVTVNKKGRIGSPWICNAQGEVYKLKFWYYLRNPRACQLTVYIQSIRNYTFLMDVGTSSRDEFTSITSPTFNSTDCVFQIIIEAKKTGNGKCGDYNRVAIDDITLLNQPGIGSCTLQTTAIPASSSQRTSYITKTIITTQTSYAQQSTSYTKSYSHSEELYLTTGNGSKAAQDTNESYSSQLSSGAIVAIATSLFTITIGIIIVVVYRRNIKGACDTSEHLKRFKIHKSNSNLTGHELRADNAMHSTEDEGCIVPTNHNKPYPHGGNLGGKNQGYEIPQVTSSPYCYSTVQDADANRHGSQTSPVSVSGRNLKNVTNSDTYDYNTLHVTPSSNPQCVAMDAYDHAHTTENLSHRKTVQEDNVYSLAHMCADSIDVNSNGNLNLSPSPSKEDEYNCLNIAGDNYPNDDRHITEFYDHLDGDTDENRSPIESLPMSPNHHSIRDNYEGDYNHLHAKLSRDQCSHTVKSYDHLEATIDHSPAEPLEGDNDYSLADDSFSRDYVNTSVIPSGIMLTGAN